MKTVFPQREKKTDPTMIQRRLHRCFVCVVLLCFAFAFANYVITHSINTSKTITYTIGTVLVFD